MVKQLESQVEEEVEEDKLKSNRGQMQQSKTSLKATDERKLQQREKVD